MCKTSFVGENVIVDEAMDYADCTHASCILVWVWKRCYNIKISFALTTFQKLLTFTIAIPEMRNKETPQNEKWYIKLYIIPSIITFAV